MDAGTAVGVGFVFADDLADDGCGVTAAKYNGSLGTNASTSFGFNGAGSGGVPTAFTLNGTACTGSVTPTGNPTTPTSPPPTAGRR